MTKQQLTDYVVKRLTGGHIITLNLTPDLISETLDDVIDIVSSWYVEEIAIETKTITLSSDTSDVSTSKNGYLNKSSLSHPVHYVDTVLPTRTSTRTGFVLDEITDLLGLPAGLFTSDAMVNYSVWLSARAMIRKSMSLTMKWKETPDQIMIHKLPTKSQAQVTVFYFPLPEKLNDVSFGPALNWIKKRFEAELKLSWSGVMLKASPDPATIGFANTIRGEANSAIEKSDAKLESLQFIYTSFQRS